MLKCVLSAVLAVCLAASPCFSAGVPADFKKTNPDSSAKYSFARSYISALGHIQSNYKMWREAPPKNKFTGGDIQLMRGYVSYLTKDDANLRIAKNYLSKYLESSNVLIRATADSFTGACMTLLAINKKEKEIWDQWFAVRSNNLGTITNEKAFIKAQGELETKRKEAYKEIITSTIMLTKVLKSEKNKDDQGKLLAITAKEREKLLENLDEYGKETLDWGIKPGQNYMQASIATIREILEDTVYIPLDE
jgi:hypothetical protein